MAARLDTGRLEAFSDGVFAIAITLLVLEISVPDDAFDDLVRAIAEQWPSYLAYVTSFLTIGALWLAHHGLFRRSSAADSVVVRLNIVLLMAVSFLPFPTSLVAEALDRGDAETTAVIFYGATLLAVSALFAAMARHIASRDELLQEGARGEVAALSSRLAPSLGFYVAVLVLAVFAPAVAAFGFLAIAVLAIVRT
jgi:uncharacterized membrane protein